MFLKKTPPIILIIGFLVRLSGLQASAIWYDEAITLYRLQLPFLSRYLDKTEASGDLLLEMILQSLVRLFGTSLWVLRLPSLVASAVCLYITWKLMIRLKFNLVQQIITSLMICFFPGLLWAAQDGRAYSILTMVVLLAVWYAIEARRIGLFSACGLCFYAHYVGPAYAVAVLGLALYLHSSSWKKIFLIGGLIILSWLPQIIIALTTINHFDWTEPIKARQLIEVWVDAIWVGTFKKTLIVACLQIIFFSTIIFSLFVPMDRIKKILGIFLGISILSLLVVSLIWSNVIIYRTLVPLLIFVALWLGWELGNIPASWRFKWKFTHGREFNIGQGLTSLMRTILAVAWVAFLIFGLINWDPARRGGHLDQIAGQIRNQWQEGDVIFYPTASVAMPFDYYLNDLPHFLMQDQISTALTPPGLSRFVIADYETLDADRIWLFIPKTTLMDPHVQNKLDKYIIDQQPAYTLTFFQFHPIDIYLIIKR